MGSRAGSSGSAAAVKSDASTCPTIIEATFAADVVLAGLHTATFRPLELRSTRIGHPGPRNRRTAAREFLAPSGLDDPHAAAQSMSE